MSQQRRGQIAEWVRRAGSVRVVDLAQQFQVSEVTIRHDLDRLAREGRVVRDHGVATAPDAHKVTSLLHLSERAALHLAEKQRIARAALLRIAPGDSLLLDAGSTVLELGRLLSEVTPLTVVTNSLGVAAELSALEDVELVLLGGSVRREAASTVGPQAEHMLRELVVQKLFLGAQALDLEHGLTDSTLGIAQIKRAMIAAARQVIVLADSAKWNRAAFTKVAPLDDLDVLITDVGLSDEAAAALERQGVEVVRV